MGRDHGQHLGIKRKAGGNGVIRIHAGECVTAHSPDGSAIHQHIRNTIVLVGGNGECLAIAGRHLHRASGSNGPACARAGGECALNRRLVILICADIRGGDGVRIRSILRAGDPPDVHGRGVIVVTRINTHTSRSQAEIAGRRIDKAGGFTGSEIYVVIITRGETGRPLIGEHTVVRSGICAAVYFQPAALLRSSSIADIVFHQDCILQRDGPGAHLPGALTSAPVSIRDDIFQINRMPATQIGHAGPIVVVGVIVENTVFNVQQAADSRKTANRRTVIPLVFSENTIADGDGAASRDADRPTPVGNTGRSITIICNRMFEREPIHHYIGAGNQQDTRAVGAKIGHPITVDIAAEDGGGCRGICPGGRRRLSAGRIKPAIHRNIGAQSEIGCFHRRLVYSGGHQNLIAGGGRPQRIGERGGICPADSRAGGVVGHIPGPAEIGGHSPRLSHGDCDGQAVGIGRSRIARPACKRVAGIGRGRGRKCAAGIIPGRAGRGAAASRRIGGQRPLVLRLEVCGDHRIRG